MTRQHPNIFASVLTHAAPSSNYRGESEMNRTVLQKISRSGHDHVVISPESMRNALREILRSRVGDAAMNRRRLEFEEQLAVEFKEFPDAAKYADDFIFGFMVADPKAIKSNAKKPSKRDSVLRMNMAVALMPYRFDATFHQSPMNGGESPWKNAAGSALLHREVSYSAFQFPVALATRQFFEDAPAAAPSWGKALLRAIGELSNVAGGHARSYFEMAPQSLVVRVTDSLVGGFDTYGFDQAGGFPELARINGEDLPGTEFLVGGALARGLPDASAEGKRLRGEGVRFFDSPQRLLETLANECFASDSKS